MGYTDIIAREADGLPPEKQAEVLDSTVFLETRINRLEGASIPRTSEEIEAFFRSFDVDVSGYKFDREEANAR